MKKKEEVEMENFKTQAKVIDPCCQDRNKTFSDGSLGVVNLNFWLTTGCNFRCRYCYEGNFKNEVIVSSKEIVEQVINWLVDPKVSGYTKEVGINFFGGEPCLCIDLIEFALFYGKKMESKTGKKIKFSMTTNASLLNKDVINFFKEFNMGYLVSIDGDFETLSKWRGLPQEPEKNKLLVSSVIENAKLILSVKPETTARITLPNEEIPSLMKNVLFLWGIGFENISAHIITDGPGAIQEDGVKEYEKQLSQMYSWFKGELKRRGRIPYATVEKLLKPITKEKSLDGNPCGAGRGFFGVSPNGEIYPCHRFVMWKEWKLGDVFHFELDKEKRKFFLEFKRKQIETCNKCSSISCNFQCFASNYAKYKDIYKFHPEYCKIKQIEEQIALKLMTDTDLKFAILKKLQQGENNDKKRTHQRNTNAIGR